MHVEELQNQTQYSVNPPKLFTQTCTSLHTEVFSPESINCFFFGRNWKKINTEVTKSLAGDFRLRMLQRLLKVNTYTILSTDMNSKKKDFAKMQFAKKRKGKRFKLSPTPGNVLLRDKFYSHI